MCDPGCLVFGAAHLSAADVSGRRVLEVGARDVNGSLRPLIQRWAPAEYVGVDIAPGPGVDRIADARHLPALFGKDRFDLVVCTEMLEHVRDWRAVVSGIKAVCAPGGSMLLTTCAPGLPYHGYPRDFWRFEPDDLAFLFGDCPISALERCYRGFGVGIKAVKPPSFTERDLSGHRLYSVIARERVADIGAWSGMRPGFIGAVVVDGLMRSIIAGISVIRRLRFLMGV